MDSTQPNPPPPSPSHYEDDEITLRELIIKVQGYYQEVAANWKILIIAALAFSTIFVVKALLTEKTYTATLTFMVNEDEGGRGGAISGLLGQFGISGGGDGKFNLPKILELSRSRQIFQGAIFDTCVIDDKRDYIANHLINYFDLHETWEDSEELKDFTFKNGNVDTYGTAENSALLTLYGKVVGSQDAPRIFSSSFDEETGILRLSTTASHEILSLYLTEAIYQSLSSFYIEKSTEKQEKTLALVKAKTDSLLNLLNSYQMQLLRFNDTNRGLVLSQYSVKQVERQRDIQILTVAYGEAMKNLEMADFSLKNATPFFQTIDRPIFPLKSNSVSLVRNVLAGFLLGGFLGLIYILGRKAFRAITEEK